MKNKLIFCSLFLLLLINISANAATVTWTGAGADNLASNPANWSGNIAPQFGDDVVFNATPKDCTWDLNVSLASLSIKSGYTGKVTKATGVTLTIAKSFVSPTVPSGLNAAAVSSNQIDLSWIDSSNNESGFKIERKIGAGGIYSQIADVGANIGTYSDMGLNAGTTYYYRVRGYNSFGDSAYSNEAGATTLTQPTAITNPSTNTTSNTVNLNGTVNPNGLNTTFYFQWGTTTSYGSTTSIQSIGSGSSDISVTANITGLSPSTTYQYRVVAINAGGTNYGNNISFTTDSGIPNISASPSSNDLGGINVGSSSLPQVFTMSNTGTGNLVIGVIILTGANANQFTKQGDTCSGMAITPSATCTVNIIFSPTFVGILNGSLSIPSNDSDTPMLNIGLSGTGVLLQCM